MQLCGREIRCRILALLALVLMLGACDSPEERALGHYERGMDLVAEGAPEKALLEFRNALELNEAHAPTHRAVGQLLERQNAFPAAFAHYERAIELDPGHAGVRTKAAQILLLMDALDKAEIQIAAALRLAPGQAYNHTLKAALALKRGNLDAVRAALDTALALDPDDPRAAVVEVSYLYQTSSPAEALVRADQALGDHPSELPLHAFKLRILEEMGDAAGVGAALAVMIEAFPGELRFREALSEWAVRNDEPEIAIDQFRALVAARPDDMHPVVNLVRFLRRQEGEAAARAELERLIAGSPEPVAFELVRARLDIETGRKEEAIAGLRGLIDRAGSRANEARIMLARLLIKEGAHDEAERLIASALAEEPGDVDALALRVGLHLDRSRLEDAAQAVRKGLDEAPDDVRLLLLAGRIQELSGNIDFANDQFARAVRADEFRSDTVQRYVQFLSMTKRFTAAEVILAEAVRRNPADRMLLDLLVSTRIQLENWGGAEVATNALAVLDPDRARQLRAAILIGQERFDEGASLLRDLPADDRRRAISIAALIEFYMRTGRPDEAVAFLEELLTQNPENIQALGIRGNLHFADGELDAAEGLYRKILEIDSGNGGAWSALARLETARGNSDGAETLIRRGLSISPENLLLLARLAQTYEGRGDFDKAIGVYEELYQIVPDSLLVANNLASLLSDHHPDDPEAVDRAYKIAGRLRQADLPQYHDTYGWTRHLKGEHEEALAQIAPVVEALPQNPWVHYHLGMIYAALDRPEEAQTMLETALELAGDSPFPPAMVIGKTLGALRKS